MAVFTREQSVKFTRKIKGGFKGNIYLHYQSGLKEVVMLPLDHVVCKKQDDELKSRGIYFIAYVNGEVGIGSITGYADSLYIMVNNEIERVVKELESVEKIYKVPVYYQSWGIVEVTAKDEKDLSKKLRNKDFVDEMELPYDPEYVEGSYKIDFEGLPAHI